MRLSTTYLVTPAGVLLIALFVASLFWCPDTACGREGADDECTSLICALLAKGTTPSQTQNSPLSSFCTCVCHMPIVSGTTSVNDGLLATCEVRLDAQTFIPGILARSIDQPPRA
jgi:hypothetical protein